MTVTSLNPARSPTCQNLCRNARIQQYPCSFTTKVVQECAIIMWIATTIITNVLNHHAHDWSTHWRQSLPTSCINTIILNRSEKHPAASLNISKHHRIFFGRYQDSSRSGQLPPIDHLLARTPAGKNVENDDGSRCHGDAWPEEWMKNVHILHYTIHLRLVGSRRSDPATQRCTAPYLTEPKLKSEDTQRRFWIHHLLGSMLQIASNYSSIFWLPAHQHASAPCIAYRYIQSHVTTRLLVLPICSPEKLMQLRMHLVQAVAVQKAHQSHQILALNPSKLASVPWSRYVQVFSFIYNSKKF